MLQDGKESMFTSESVKSTPLIISTITLQGHFTNVDFNENDINLYKWAFLPSIYKVVSPKHKPIINKKYVGEIKNTMKKKSKKLNGKKYSNCFNSCFQISVYVKDKCYPVKVFRTGALGIPGHNSKNYENAYTAANIIKEFIYT